MDNREDKKFEKENLTSLEKVREIYINLGKKFSYNRDYLYCEWEQSQEIYERTIMPTMLDNVGDSKKVKALCKQMSENLVESINSIPKESNKENIIARVIGYQSGEENHVGVLVTISEKIYYLDLYKDLYRIQRGMQTKYFAPSKENLENIKQQYPSVNREIENINLETIEDEQLKQMDNKLGYLKYGLYIDDVIEKLKSEMQNEENFKQYIEKDSDINSKENRRKAILKWKIDFIFKYLKNEIAERKMEIPEIDKFYKKIYYSLLTPEEKQSSILSSIDIHRIDELGNKQEAILYRIFLRDEDINYIYENKEEGFIPISKQEIQKRRLDKKIIFDGFEK